MPTEPAADADCVTVNHPFSITWPLHDPVREASKTGTTTLRTLLHGSLMVRSEPTETRGTRLVLRVTLTRPDDEAFRQFWNRSLMYEEYGWMKLVRVWDRDHQWLYPNLAFLFKLHGVDRVGRYGGWDPGKHVDNDFGAVLIRVFSDVGDSYTETTDAPLVSAAWTAADGQYHSRTELVHVARSDEFSICVPAADAAQKLQVRVWLVYGDFMDRRAPASWPKEPEAAGGALAFFAVNWQLQPEAAPTLVVHPKRPELTGFDWTRWIDRPRQDVEPVGKPRLTLTLGSR